MKTSVCMATFNGGKYIKTQIESILSQLNDSDELIISDDGSSDGTIEVIESFNDKRITLLNHAKKKENYKGSYTTRNFEHALNNASGDIIFLSDQDDVWSERQVEKMSKLLCYNDLVLSNCIVTDESLNLLHDSYFDLIRSKKGLINNIIKNAYLGCCMAFKKEILNIALPIPPGPIAHDIWIGLIAECYGNPFFYREPLVFYRRHSNNVSTSANKSNNTLAFKIYYRLCILLRLFILIIKRKCSKSV
jgi:glycosyltransferase involved in cell wall biosynthesis